MAKSPRPSFPLCILRAIKNWGQGWPGNEAMMNLHHMIGAIALVHLVTVSTDWLCSSYTGWTNFCARYCATCVEILLVSRALTPDVQSKLYGHHLRRHYQHQVQGDCYSHGTHNYHHVCYKAILLYLLPGQGQLDWTIESVGAEWTLEVSQENVVPQCDGFSGHAARYDGKLLVCSHSIIL